MMDRTLSQPQPVQAPPVRLRVVLRLDKDGPELTREAVTDADLADVCSELWLVALLRKGHPNVAIQAMSSRLVPLLREEGGPRCTGFALETTSADGQVTRCEFSILALDRVAARASKRLLGDGSLQPGDSYFFEVVADRRPVLPAAPRDPQTESAAFTITAQHEPLRFLSVPLAPLLKQAETIGEVDERWVSVFYTRAALSRAEHYARKGGRNGSATETGAVLVGPLCSCPESGEFFVVVCDALEVQDAEQAEFSLTYSSKSWARIQAVIRAQQAQPATRAHRILGQCHGHNFLPADGAPPCDLCAKVKVCTRTSVFVSPADRTWSQAVFTRQPWQLCHIFGLNARKEEVHSLFGLRDGRLLERGFHVLPEFRPEGKV